MPRKAKGEPLIEDLIIDLMRKGQSNPVILAHVEDAFPEAVTTLQSVAWYRKQLRRQGEPIPTSRQAAKAMSPLDM